VTRRVFLALAAAGAAWPVTAFAQGSVRRVGVLMSYREGDPEGQSRLAAFRDSLREAGWSEGRNASLEVRWLAGSAERARNEAQALVAQAPDVILVNGTPGLSALRSVTSTIPVVFVVVTNPVGAGFVDSLARPGGNITGFSTFEPEIGGKWLETLKALAPRLTRVGVLHDPEAAGFLALWRGTESAAAGFALSAVPIHARNPTEIRSGIEEFASRGNGALVVLPNPINSVERQSIFALAERHRLPAIYPFAFHARDGGLAAYGFDAQDLFRRAGPYVARILTGEKPGDLPVQAPSKYELVLNLKAARAIALDVPPPLLARADEVIE
jgi:putative ABC transport system substrate-binding protein